MTKINWKLIHGNECKSKHVLGSVYMDGRMYDIEIFNEKLLVSLRNEEGTFAQAFGDPSELLELLTNIAGSFDDFLMAHMDGFPSKGYPQRRLVHPVKELDSLKVE